MTHAVATPATRSRSVLAPTAAAPGRARLITEDACHRQGWDSPRATEVAEVVGGLVALAVRESAAPVVLALTAEPTALSVRIRADVTGDVGRRAGTDRAAWKTAQRHCSSWQHSVTDLEREITATFARQPAPLMKDSPSTTGTTRGGRR